MASPLHVVEELFVDDLAVGDFVDGHLFEREPFGLRFEGDVKFESDSEVRSRDKRTLNCSRVDIVVGGPPFAFGLNGRKAFRLARCSGRRAGFHADDIGRVKSFRGFVKLAFRAKFRRAYSQLPGWSWSISCADFLYEAITACGLLRPIRKDLEVFKRPTRKIPGIIAPVLLSSAAPAS